MHHYSRPSPQHMEIRFRGSTFKDHLTAVRARVVALFPLGITARLSISLAAVAVLGAAANMLAQESVSIIRIRMSMPPNVPAPNLPAAPSLFLEGLYLSGADVVLKGRFDTVRLLCCTCPRRRLL